MIRRFDAARWGIRLLHCATMSFVLFESLEPRRMFADVGADRAGRCRHRAGSDAADQRRDRRSPPFHRFISTSERSPTTPPKTYGQLGREESPHRQLRSVRNAKEIVTPKSGTHTISAKASGKKRTRMSEPFAEVQRDGRQRVAREFAVPGNGNPPPVWPRRVSRVGRIRCETRPERVDEQSLGTEENPR